MVHDPRLRFAHALAAGRPRKTPALVPTPPLRVLGEVDEIEAGPGAEIDFVQRVCDLERTALARRFDRPRRLDGAPPRTGVDVIESLAAHSFSHAAGLRLAGFAETGARRAPRQPNREVVLSGVADQEKHRHDSRRGLAPSPSEMNFRTRSRASASVNCSGGDFM